MGKLLVIDGQGGGIGKSIVERLKALYPSTEITAIGTNSLATMAMIKAGADVCATGENAIVVNAAKADIIMGPFGIVMADALMGECTGKMAEAVSSSRALKILVPVSRCNTLIAGIEDISLSGLIDDAVAKVRNFL